jgi:hypothetical protein
MGVLAAEALSFRSPATSIRMGGVKPLLKGMNMNEQGRKDLERKAQMSRDINRVIATDIVKVLYNEVDKIKLVAEDGSKVGPLQGTDLETRFDSFLYHSGVLYMMATAMLNSDVTGTQLMQVFEQEISAWAGMGLGLTGKVVWKTTSP